MLYQLVKTIFLHYFRKWIFVETKRKKKPFWQSLNAVCSTCIIKMMKLIYRHHTDRITNKHCAFLQINVEYIFTPTKQSHMSCSWKYCCRLIILKGPQFQDSCMLYNKIKVIIINITTCFSFGLHAQSALFYALFWCKTRCWQGNKNIILPSCF